MIKEFIILLIFNCPFVIYSQNTNDEVLIANYGRYTHFHNILLRYTNELNFWSKSDSVDLPDFLFEKEFDFFKLRLINRDLCLDKKEWQLSFRKLIFDYVYNVQVLEAIVNSPDSRLDSLYNYREKREIPYMAIKKEYVDGPKILWMEYSTRELARIRLEDLKKLSKQYSR